MKPKPRMRLWKGHSKWQCYSGGLQGMLLTKEPFTIGFGDTPAEAYEAWHVQLPEAGIQPILGHSHPVPWWKDETGVYGKLLSVGDDRPVSAPLRIWRRLFP